MTLSIVLVFFAAFVHAFVALNNPPSPGWLQWLQRPLCSLLHAHNIHEWEQRGCAQDVSTNWTPASPAFPTKPLFSLSSSTKTSPITSKSHTMIVCLQGLAKDHKETKLSQQPSQLNREGYGMNYFSRLLGLNGPDSNQGHIHEAAAGNMIQATDFVNGMRAEDSTVHPAYQSTPLSLLSLDPTHIDYDDDDQDGVLVPPDTCAEGDERYCTHPPSLSRYTLSHILLNTPINTHSQHTFLYSTLSPPSHHTLLIIIQSGICGDLQWSPFHHGQSAFPPHQANAYSSRQT